MVFKKKNNWLLFGEWTMKAGTSYEAISAVQANNDNGLG